MPPDLFVYLLSDPRTGEGRYVGQTTVGMRRPLQHGEESYLRADPNIHKVRWVRSLHRIGVMFEIDILEKCSTRDELNEAEVFWIGYLRMIGCRLLNLTPGGAPRVPMSAQTRARISAAALRRPSRPHTEEEKRQRSDAGKTNPRIQASIAKAQAACRGRKASPETRAKISAAAMGHKRCVGRTYSPETIAKMATSARRRWAQARSKMRPTMKINLLPRMAA